jgi:hypothetical protein
LSDEGFKKSFGELLVETFHGYDPTDLLLVDFVFRVEPALILL